MRRAHFTSRAEQDLTKICDYLADFSLQSAVNLERRVEEAVERLVMWPGMGPEREELAPRLRSFPVGDYLILYQPVDDGIQIIRIVHGSRDLFRLFKRPGS
jgi:toxin ParE1/3/4